MNKKIETLKALAIIRSKLEAFETMERADRSRKINRFEQGWVCGGLYALRSIENSIQNEAEVKKK